MSGSPSRPARVLPGALLGLVLAAPAGVLAVPSASAAPRVEVAPLSDACGVRLDLRGLPARTFTVHLDLVALDPVRALALTPPGPREVDGGSPSAMDVTAEGLSAATASRAYRATVRLDGEAQPPVELVLPECADPATATASPTATATAPPGSPGATPNPSGTATSSPSGPAGPAASGTATPSPSGTAGPAASGTATSSPSSTTSPATSPTSATSTAAIDPEPTEAPVFGPRAVSAPATGGSGVVALSGGVAAAPLGALPELAAPAPVVAPPTGGMAAAVAAAPPLAAVLPSLPGQVAVAPAPAPQAVAPEAAAAPPVVAMDTTTTNGTWTAGLPAALLAAGAASGALCLRLRRRS